MCLCGMAVRLLCFNQLGDICSIFFHTDIAGSYSQYSQRWRRNGEAIDKLPYLLWWVKWVNIPSILNVPENLSGEMWLLSEILSTCQLDWSKPGHQKDYVHKVLGSIKIFDLHIMLKNGYYCMWTCLSARCKITWKFTLQKDTFRMCSVSVVLLRQPNCGSLVHILEKIISIPRFAETLKEAVAGSCCQGVLGCRTCVTRSMETNGTLCPLCRSDNPQLIAVRGLDDLFSALARIFPSDWSGELSG